ncbi:MAG TPA: DUF6768 family protein [Sedimentisphaerales bacterium]|nr:DUF6768 family protein [Sedimentisphaerales bacterium]
MENLEQRLRTTLSGADKFDAAKAETLRKEVVQMYDKKLKMVKLATQISLLVLAAMIVYGLRRLSHSEKTVDMFAYAIVIVILSQGTVLMKLWYWVLNTKYGVLKELKQLQLQIAEMAGKTPPSES